MVISIAEKILLIERPHPIRVAIDGIDAAGKTTLAKQLATILEEQGRSVIQASIDDFHNPKAVRQQRGTLSPEGYFYDTQNVN